MTIRVGHKVECIDDAPRKGRVWMGIGTKPKVGAVYTVTGVMTCEDGTVLRLRELVNYEDAGYRASRFRPLPEARPESIAIFTTMLTTPKHCEHVDR